MSVCIWKYQINIQVWKGNCDILINAKLLKQFQAGANFNFCPQCGNAMVKENNPDVDTIICYQDQARRDRKIAEIQKRGKTIW